VKPAALALLVSIAIPVHAHPPVAPTLERLIPHLMLEGEVPGLSIVVIQDGSVHWQRAFGVANRDTGQPLTHRSIFESASLTKPLFAYAVLKLAEAGVLSLDTPLYEYLPEPVSDERMKRITTRMVLAHTTGFQNEVMPGETLKVHFAPGTRFSYSGAGFLYLQRVVEHRTRKRLPALMRELVFDPLGMTESAYVWLPQYEQRKAFGHNAAGVVAQRRKPAEATVATLHTTPLDYARFLIATMKRSGLKPATSQAMLTSQASIDESCFSCLNDNKGSISTALSWGLGWGLERTARGTAFWHWGENNGEFQNFAMGYPDGDGVVIFTNSGNGFSIMPEIVAAAVGGEHPAFAWIRYESYQSPARVLLRDIVRRGADVALTQRAVEALSEPQINSIGYALLQRRRIRDAIAAFRTNVERFPMSFNAYDSLGEAYAAAGDRANAIANYQRSFELNPKNTNAAESLLKLRR
jgi:CubicO group peptidase (beta-lactamase class C family)